MSESEDRPGRLGTAIAVLIALVSVTAAVISWRVSVALGNAGGADGAGLQAESTRQDIATYAAITLTQHRDAFVSYLRNDKLADAYQVGARDKPDRTDLLHYGRSFRSAANFALDAIPNAYIDRDGHLDQARDLGEHIAQDSRNQDVDPLRHYAEADAERQKGMFLFGAILLLGMASLLFTVANAIPGWPSHLFLIAGVGLYGLAVLVALFAEYLGPLIFQPR